MLIVFCDNDNAYMFVQVRHGVGIEDIVDHVLHAWEVATGEKRH